MALIFDTSLDINGKPVKPVEVDQSFDPTSTNAQSGVAVKEAVDQAVEGIYKPAGSLSFANLPTPSADILGFVYNITDAFTTDARFVEGAGTECAAGTNVVVVNAGTSQSPVYKFDILAAGAVQVQSDWSQTDTSAVDYIKNKPTIPTVNDATLTISQNGVLKGVFTANSSTNVDVLLENLPADFITNQNSAQTATTPLKVWEGSISDYEDQASSTGTFYAWDMSGGGWTAYTMEYPITNSSVIYWYSAGDYGPTSNTIIYTNGTTSFVRDDYTEFRYTPSKNIIGSNIGPDTVCFVEGQGIKTGAGIDIANLSSGSTTAEEIVNANEATGVTSPLKVWQGTEQQWTNGKDTDWYCWKTDVALSSNTTSMPSQRTWRSLASNGSRIVAVCFGVYNYNRGVKVYAYSDDNGATWTQGNLPNSLIYIDVKYGNDIFVAVGSQGSDTSGTIDNIAYSNDGTNWSTAAVTAFTQGSNGTLAYGNGIFVLSNNTAFSTSTDGINWTYYSSLPSISIGASLVFCKDRFIGVSPYSTNKFGYSFDGVTWNSGTFPSTGYWNDVTYGNGIFVACNGKYYSSTVCATSTDGLTWTNRTVPSGKWWSIDFSNNVFMMREYETSRCLYSIDGINWTEGTLPAWSNSDTLATTSGFILPKYNGTDCYNIEFAQGSVYTLSTTPETTSTVYSEPNTTSALTITSIGTGTITLSDNNTYTYTSSGDVTTYQTIGDAYPNYLANINGVGVKIGNTLIADNTDTSTLQTKTNLVTSVSSSSTDSQYPSAKLLYDTVGNIEATLDAIIAQGSNS